jgi:hypothetical protein
MSQPAACTCGQVLFDVGDKKPNDVLTCPWCDRKYSYLGNGKVEAFDPNIKPAEAPGKPEPTRKSGRHPEQSDKTSDDKKPDEKKAEQPHAKKHDGEKKPLAATARHAPTGESGRPSVRKRAHKGDIPGGVGVMVGFIVVFNASAFLLLMVVLPKAVDGTRTTPWHSVIPKSAIWPEIAALLVGHLVGFLAWSTYLYYRQQRLTREAAQAALAPPAQPGSGMNAH